MIRVYANWLSERNRWCVDTGPGTTIWAVKRVYMRSLGVTRSQVRRKRDAKTPSMWIEFPAATYYIRRGIAEIF